MLISLHQQAEATQKIWAGIQASSERARVVAERRERHVAGMEAECAWVTKTKCARIYVRVMRTAAVRDKRSERQLPALGYRRGLAPRPAASRPSERILRAAWAFRKGSLARPTSPSPASPYLRFTLL